jgi:hypothetical protein
MLWKAWTVRTSGTALQVGVSLVLLRHCNPHGYTRTMRLTMRVRLWAMLVWGLLVAGCFSSRPVATPADLERLGTRHYSDRSPAEVAAAVGTALKLLGYQIVTMEPRIRTAPKDVATTAVGTYGTYSGSAHTYTETVAWDIDVHSEGASVTLRATPRAAVNGVPMEQVYIEWADRTFPELMREIDGNLPPK